MMTTTTIPLSRPIVLARPHGFDRLIVVLGETLVRWGHRRAARLAALDEALARRDADPGLVMARAEAYARSIR